MTAIPEGYVHARTTDLWDNDTVPDGLLRAHRVAEGVYGRFVIRSGAAQFMFEDDAEHPIDVSASDPSAVDAVVIPPGRPHRVILDGPATFQVEFYRQPDVVSFVKTGDESTGLHGGDPV